MTYNTITTHTTDNVAVLTLNRPDVMNALTSTLRRELLDAITHAAKTARAIVITGAGRAFCSGQDLAAFTSLRPEDIERLLRDEYEPLLRAIYDCPIPTIAAVNGAAVGAGANLALAADVVIATHSASFSQSFTRIGLIPDAGGTYWLPRQVGMPRAMGSALFADRITATQAAQWGMIYECVPDADFTAHWQARAAHLAAGPTQAYAHLKHALRASYANDLTTQLALEARLQGECGQTQDFAEGVAAFLEKRTANFQGH